MARPRVFVSSTFYDLRHIRDRLREFIDELGYEPVLSEAGDIPYHPSKALDSSCYDEVDRCHIVVLIIGGRHGSAATGQRKLPETAPKLDQMYQHYRSITELECTRALERGTPVYTLVEKSVLHEFETFKRNKSREDIEYASVENTNVFRLLAELNQRSVNKALAGFDNFDDIADWLRSQWAGLFASMLLNRQSASQIEGLSAQIGKLEDIAKAVQEYSKNIVELVAKKPQDADAIKNSVETTLHDRALLRFATTDAAANLGVPRKLRPSEVLSELERSTSASSFFSALGFTPRQEADGRQTFFHTGGGRYVYWSDPDRTFAKLRNQFNLP